LKSAAIKLSQSLKNAFEAICWTDGPFPAGFYDTTTGSVYILEIPQLPGKVLSPIGAGDAVAAGLFYSWVTQS